MAKNPFDEIIVSDDPFAAVARRDATAAGDPAPGRRRGRDTEVLPFLGGLGGQVVGAGVGLPLAPMTGGASVILGALLGGSLGQGGGSAAQQGLEGRPITLGETGRQAMYGGLTAAGGEAASGVLNVIGRGLLGTSIGKFDPEIISALQRERIAPSRNAAQEMGRRISPIGLERQVALDASVAGGQRWYADDITGGLRDLIRQMQENPLTDAPARAAQKRLDFFNSKYGGRPLNANEVQLIKEAADREAEGLWEAARKAKVQVSVNSPTMRVLKQQGAIANGARDALSNVPSVVPRVNVSNVSDLNELMSPMMRAKKALAESQEAVPSFSLSRPRAGEVAAAMLGGGRQVAGLAGLAIGDPIFRALVARAPAAAMLWAAHNAGSGSAPDTTQSSNPFDEVQGYAGGGFVLGAAPPPHHANFLTWDSARLKKELDGLSGNDFHTKATRWAYQKRLREVSK